MPFLKTHSVYPREPFFHIEKLADEFLEEFYETTEYIAVHWRFDLKDWKRGCYASTNNRKALCDLIKDVTYKDIAGTVLSFIARNQEEFSGIGVYIASPPNAKEMISEVIQVMQDFYKNDTLSSDFNHFNNTLKFYGMSDLEDWAKLRYPDCESVMSDTETLSMVEQQIAIKSKFLASAPSSSWSLRVIDIGLRGEDTVPFLEN